MSAREWIRERALALGFDAVGFARAPGPEEPFAEGLRLREWLERGYAGEMRYLARSAAGRAAPAAVLPGVKSVVALAKRYPGLAPEPGPREGRVALYARGRDYHNVLGTRVRKLLKEVLARWPDDEAFAYVDRGPVLEKAWAARAGLGWVGKNTLLLHPERGSYTLLAAMLSTLELAPDAPVPDQCGACRLCLDACPTAAFPEPYVIDARRCISYLTIELRGDVPEELRAAVGDRLFGCDVCQDVCPWNRRPLAELDPSFAPDRPLHEAIDGVLGLDAEGFVTLTRGRPLARPGRDGLVRNACVVAGNSGDPGFIPALARLGRDASAMIRRHAAWAVARISRLRGAGAGAAPGSPAPPRGRGAA